MTFDFDSSGISIQTFEEALAEWQEEYRSRLSSSIATEINSAAGQLQRLSALRDTQTQEKIQQLYQSLDPRLAEGVHLDIRNAALGIIRQPAASAEVLGTFTGTAGTSIPNGFRVSVGGYEFSVINGPYLIEAGGTVSNVRISSTLQQTIDVSTLGAWTLVDAVAGVTSFDDDSQPINGQVVESDADYRERADVERFNRSLNSLAAIDAAVSQVAGVTYVRSWHHIDPSVADPDPVTGIPFQAINTIVEGGDDEAVAIAIESAAPAGTQLYGTDVAVTLGSGVDSRVINFDRVDEIEIWIQVVILAGTSEVEQLSLADLTTAVEDVLRTFTASKWQIGTDVLHHEIEAAIVSSSIPSFDSISVTTSLDDVVYNSDKISISIRERATFSVDRLTVTDVE